MNSHPKNFIDMTGWIMKEHGIQDSKWTVLHYSGEKKWHCLCECGREKDVNAQSLRRGLSKSCGECNRIAPNLIDETGNKYGYLTVLEPDIQSSKDGHKKWICQCKCGKICSVKGKELRNGHTSSCGCLQSEDASERRKADLIGKQFTYLTVLELGYTDKNNGEQFWKCKCKCGNIAYVSTHSLNQGNKKSCGCLASAGEAKIRKILQDNKVEFAGQYSFPELRKKRPLRFDFAIFQEGRLCCLIEYQGYQHYDKTSNWCPEESDEMKRDYCKKKNISLIEIPYTDYDKIDYNYLKEKCDL